MCLFLNPHILYLDGWVGGEGGREGLPIITYTGRRCPKGYLFPFRIDYSTLFSTFDMGKLNKSMERTPLTRKIAKSKSGICWKPTKFRQILQTSVWWGSGTNLLFPLPTLHVQKSVNFGNFTELYLCALKTYVSLSHLAMIQPLKLKLNFC